MEYQLIRSRRKTLAICVNVQGEVIVRAPMRMSMAKIQAFLDEKEEWIHRTQEKQQKISAQRKDIVLTADQIRQVKQLVKEDLIQRCKTYEPLLGVKCNALKVNSAKSHWGSCNSKGTINFTYRLWFAPESLRDYVVVHELAHLIEMNHSERFWKHVERVLPDYKQRRRQLKEFQGQVAIIEGAEQK